MTMRLRSAMLLAVLPLAGCIAPVPPAARDDAAPPAGFTDAKQSLVYLDVIDGLIKQGRGGAALAFLDRYAAGRRDLSPRYWLLRGHALSGADHDNEALAAYDMLDRTPLAGQGWNGKGRLAAAADAWRAAAADFERACQLDPANSDFLNNLGFAQLKQGQTQAALARLRQAHELDPGSVVVRNNLVVALTLSGDAKGAAALLQAIANSQDRARGEADARAALAAMDLRKGARS